nr:hypothetical protein [Pseudomonadota bacterium]
DLCRGGCGRRSDCRGDRGAGIDWQYPEFLRRIDRFRTRVQPDIKDDLQIDTVIYFKLEILGLK